MKILCCRWVRSWLLLFLFFPFFIRNVEISFCSSTKGSFFCVISPYLIYRIDTRNLYRLSNGGVAKRRERMGETAGARFVGTSQGEGGRGASSSFGGDVVPRRSLAASAHAFHEEVAVKRRTKGKDSGTGRIRWYMVHSTVWYVLITV